MKKLSLILVSLAFSGAAFAQKDYVTFEAKIDNPNGDKLYIIEGNKKRKEMTVKDGVFKDTLKVTAGFFRIYDGVENSLIYLKNGYNLKLKMDAKQFDESIVYTGIGEAENNFLAQSALLEEKFDVDGLLASDEASFKKSLEAKKKSDLERLETKKLDPNFVTLQKQNIDESLLGLQEYYKETVEMNKMNNTVSPTFDYENHKGGKTKLQDLKGKYVYIDVWATWCGPCRAEIPFLKKVEEKYHGKNIEFVSISVDTKKDYEKWKKFVSEKELGGMQLYADNDWNSDFIKAYGINSIPRFILIDPTGKIVASSAERPSSDKLQPLLDKLLK